MTRVLIVEDDDDIVSTVGEVLRDEGYEVTSVNNGLDGLDALHGLHGEPIPDLVLLDLMMPDVSGWDFLRAKDNDADVRGVPVIVLTAVASYQARTKELERVLLILHKPFDYDKLVTAVKHATCPRPTNRPPPM